MTGPINKEPIKTILIILLLLIAGIVMYSLFNYLIELKLIKAPILF